MGIDSDGILCYGLLLQPVLSHDTDDDIYFWHKEGDRDFDHDDWLRGAFGGDYASRSVDIVAHCSYMYPRYILAIKGSRKKAGRGWPETVYPAQMLEIEATGKQTIIEFCAKHGIPCNPEDVRWWLCSMYG